MEKYAPIIILCFVLYFLLAIYKEIYKDYKIVLRQEERRIQKEIEIQDEILGWKERED